MGFMQAHSLSDALSASPQIVLEDLNAIQEQGYESLLICRPDGEGGQLDSDLIAVEAEKLGLKTAYVPFEIGQNPGEVLPAFEAALNDLDGPVLGYCKSGMRVAVLWALSQKGKQSARDILAAGAAAGYDLSMLEAML